MEVTLTADEWDAPPPSCPECDRREMQQEFRPVAIVNSSPHSRARALADDIIGNDYQVADIQHEHRAEGTPKVRYKDENPQPVSGPPPSRWQAPDAALETAIGYGRQIRQKYGNGLDVLQSNLKRGVEPDLIELSKRRSARIW